MEDLQYAETPTEYKKLDAAVARKCQGFLKSYKQLLDLDSGRQGVIPYSLKSHIESVFDLWDQPPPWAYTAPHKGNPDPAMVMYEIGLGQEALKIYRQADKCEKEALPEAAWNTKVYAPFLGVVLSHPKFGGRLESMDLTTARIQPKSLAINHTSNVPMQTKMVDMGICIVPSDALQKRIHRHLSTLDASHQSTNQTMMPSLRRNPIAISFEAKTPYTGGQTSDDQSSIWVGAGITRLRQIVNTHNKGAPRKELPLLPALSAHGHHLDLVAFEEQLDRNVMYGKLSLGSSYTLLGVFQMINAAEILAEWADGEYTSWLEEEGLG